MGHKSVYQHVTMAGAFDDLQSRDVRLLDLASRLGPLRLRVFDDLLAEGMTGRAVKFPLEERLYALEAMTFVDRVEVVHGALDSMDLDAIYGSDPGHVAVGRLTRELDEFGKKRGLGVTEVGGEAIDVYPEPAACPENPTTGRRKVLVTGCFDWLHTGHIRFFEEVSELGELYVVVGSDANIRLLKGEGKPKFPYQQRCYMVGAVRFVKQAIVSTGHGWLDAEPEVVRLRPDAYAVNEDGDVAEKREFCRRHGVEYIVLKRLPKPGLKGRSSTALRGY